MRLIRCGECQACLVLRKIKAILNISSGSGDRDLRTYQFVAAQNPCLYANDDKEKS